MISFKQFLYEQEDVDQDTAQAVTAFLKHCSDWNADKPIWRLDGLRRDYDENLNRTDVPRNKNHLRSTRVRKRRSIAGTGEIQDFIFGLPAFSGFPDRAKSIFCSTNEDFEVGDQYDTHMYAIFPFNGTKLAVTTKSSDFNYTKFNFGGQEITDIYDLESNFDRMLMTMDIDENDFKRFTALKFGEKIELFLSKFSDRNVDASEVPVRNFFLKIKELTPQDLGFKLMTPSNFDYKLIGKQHEVWFEGKYLAVHKEDYQEFITELKSRQK